MGFIKRGNGEVLDVIDNVDVSPEDLKKKMDKLKEAKLTAEQKKDGVKKSDEKAN